MIPLGDAALVTDLDTTIPGVQAWANEPPEILAHRAADWLESEISRPIERHEWLLPLFRHRRWVFADTGTVLIESDSQNRRRTNLGSPGRITLVSGKARR